MPAQPPEPADTVIRLDWVCSDPLYDSAQWNASVPDISVCLQKTIPVWIPCGFLWLAAPFLIYSLLKSKHVGIPPTLLNIVATILALGLFVFALFDLIFFTALHSGAPVDILEPILRALTWLLTVVILQLNRLRGCRNSPVLWLFWTSFLLLSLPRLYSQIKREVDTEGSSGFLTETISFGFTFLIIFGQWILAFFMDAKPAYSTGEGKIAFLFTSPGNLIQDVVTSFSAGTLPRVHWLTSSLLSLGEIQLKFVFPRTSLCLLLNCKVVQDMTNGQRTKYLLNCK